MQKGKLYLIPSTIGETAVDMVIPSYNNNVINTINIYIVEEIRTARRFLKKAGIIKPIDELTFLVLNEHSKPEEIANYLDAISKGENIGLLSEAGLPCIADPGADIVRIAQQKNIEVIPLVGPSSILLALMASGFNGQQFTFLGYLPVDKVLRISRIKEIEKNAYQRNETQIFIEAPYRNNQLIESLLQTCRGETLLCIATDITLPNAFIKTKTIASWKKSVPDFHKKTTVFLLYK
ncbi:MAG: SAM-dependent methyltransferase [Bacteroidetes bacterium]|nr:SAM-dependent methyltransferase [Bacteroidota bacterium]